jgi:spoIIIJ-associated protein
LGIGAEDARIAVSLAPEVAPGEISASAPSAHEEPSPAAADAPLLDEDRKGDNADLAMDLLEELLEKMGVEADIELREEEPITLNVIGEDLGILIGRRGETLAAVQFVLNQMLNQKTGDWLSVIVDAEDYRLRREEQLQGLARRMADRARYYRQSVTLEPMPPNERRIVHMALADDANVETHSIGEGDDRRVVIAPK